jgi:hypothetical protein
VSWPSLACRQVFAGWEGAVSLGRFAGFRSRKLAQFGHGGVRRIFPLAALAASFRFGYIVILSHVLFL